MRVYNDTLPSELNYITIPDVFNPPTCSPYDVTVEAHNSFGYTKFATYIEVSETGSNSSEYNIVIQ